MHSVRWPAALVLLWSSLGWGALPPPTSPADGEAKEEKEVQGSWKIGKIEYDGKPEKPDRSALVLITEAKVIYRFDGGWIFGKNSVEWTYTVDPAKDPKTFDLMSKDEKGKERMEPGIYERRGRQLKVCLGKKRPKDFTAGKGSGRLSHEKPPREKKTRKPGSPLPA
jgi:uncharacterized protein (TIGR03067 family)